MRIAYISCLTLAITCSLVSMPSVSKADDKKADEKLSSEEQFANGLKKWEEAKKKCNGDYSYQVRWSSFSGFGHTTTITVKNNKIVQRDYEEFNLRAPIPGEAPQQGKKWSETGKQIGKHKEGAPAKTLDEIYAEGKKVLKMKLEPHEKLYVRLDKNGLPTSCFYIDTRIADDAPITGFSISNVKLNLPH